MTGLLFFVCEILLGGMLWWGAIKILDRYNTKNKPVTALALTLVFAVSARVGGVFLGIPGLVGLIWLLMRYYDIGLVRTILVLVVNAVLAVGAGYALIAVLGDSFDEPTLGHALGLCGVTGVAVFFWFRQTGVIGRTRDRDREPIPEARVERTKRRGSRSAKAAKPDPEPAPQQPAQQPAPSQPAPPPMAPQPPLLPPPESAGAVAPPAMESTSQAPPEQPLPEPGDDPDEPRFLR